MGLTVKDINIYEENVSTDLGKEICELSDLSTQLFIAYLQTEFKRKYENYPQYQLIRSSLTQAYKATNNPFDQEVDGNLAYKLAMEVSQKNDKNIIKVLEEIGMDIPNLNGVITGIKQIHQIKSS